MAATVHPDDRELLNEMTSAPIPSPAERNLEYRTIWPDGTIHRINLRGQVKLDADGKSVRGAGVVLDVTERRLLEEQLRQTLKLEAVGQLAGGIAHDFNNLLTIITGNTQLALETLPDASVVQEDLEHALVAAERAAQLTRQLLAFSRRQILRTEPVDIANLVDEITPLLQRLVGEDVGVTTKTIGANVVTIADRAELEQALINLVINSRDAMPSGGALNIVTKAIRLDAMAIGRQRLDLDPGDYVEMRVTDSGTGMSPDVLARAIEPFFSTKVIGKGSGLGLPSAYGTVKQIGGHLRIESTIGHGTTVTIVLPRAAAVETPQALPMGECDAVDGNLATILLMENDAALNERTRKAVGLAS
jgi:signal transduction histidine kinase